MKFTLLAVPIAALITSIAGAQATPEQVRSILSQAVQEPGITEYQLRRYLMARVPPLPTPRSAGEWRAEAERLRKQILDDIVFHGWPREWIDAPLKCEDLGVFHSGDGYRMRKLRYEIVPGFQSAAILYEPAKLSGKVPAILNVNGHVGQPGKAIEYKQKRCINYARRGLLALSLEWLGMGELHRPGNEHDFGAHLDLVGVNAQGLFYLAMRKGLDYLYEHPNVDRNRLGMTGLSGGGWQTIVLSALDERVSVAVPVAGYSSLASNIVHPRDTGEIEEDATDFRAGVDYTHLTALRSPRPTLLVYNAEDDCCFRAPMVKADTYDQVRRFFRLFDKESAFQWHENSDPGTHNYQLDNRLQSYRFFSKHFNLPAIEREIPVDAEIKSYEELEVGLPQDNLSILGVAKRLAAEIRRPAPPEGETARAEWEAEARKRLRAIVRFRSVDVKEAWMVANTKNKGVETRSYRFELSNGLSTTGVWLKAITSPENAPITVLLHDQGKRELSGQAADRVNRGEQVLALDLLFTGDESPANPAPFCYTLLLATTGDRPVGMRAAQLIGVARWLEASTGVARARLESAGIRSQVAALIATVVEPGTFSGVVVHQGMRSLGYLLDAPVKYRDAPDLFCLDLYKEFDVHLFASLAKPATVEQSFLAPARK